MSNNIHSGLGNNAQQISAAPSTPAVVVVDQCRGQGNRTEQAAFERGGPTAYFRSPGLSQRLQIPNTLAAANRDLERIGVKISNPLGRTAAADKAREPTAAELEAAAAQLKPGHAMLRAHYKGVYTETLAAEAGYAQDKDYQMRLVSDDKGAFGVASGWFLGPTGFQIDYLSPIEHPRAGQEEKDVTAGLALMRKMAHEHGAQALWVEVDPEMRKHYEKAGFVDLAAPQATDPAQLTMMVLPLSSKMKKALSTEEGQTKVWLQHIDAWYAANWDSVGDPGAKEALDKMRADSASGKRTWYQALPE